MSEQLQLRRGTSAQVAAFTGAAGEIVVDTTNNRLVLQDGATAGGFAAAKLAETITNTRTAVADAAYVVLTTDRLVAYTSITASRAVTLPAASAYPTGTILTVIDESGSCSATNTITLNRAGSDTINGATSVVLNTAYAFVQLESNGSAKWTEVDLAVPPSSTTPNMDGSATIGTSTTYARADHIHPSDTTRAALAGATFTGAVVAAVGTTVLAPLKLQSGTNLTAAAAGAFEYDGTVGYFTVAASERGVLVAEQVEVLSAAYTLTSQTAAQKLLNATANGAISLAVGTYEFECVFSLTSMSASSGSFGFALGGAATFTQAWWATAAQVATLATPATPQSTFNTAANTSLTTAGTNTSGCAVIRGIIRVTVAGTVIPQVSLGVAAAAIVGANSFFRVVPIGAAAVTSVGNWS